MESREFADTHGARWVVRMVVPHHTRDTLPGSHAAGWLTVESERGERRRLAPVPGEWERCSETRLQLMVALARPVPPIGARAAAPRAADEARG